VAAKLGIADLVSSGPKPINELAEATGSDVLSLYRLLRLLCSVGIFTEIEERHFGLTPLADTLRTDTAGSMRALATLYGEEVFWKSWGQLEHSIKTGETAFQHAFGKTLYAYLAAASELSSLFDQAMSGLVSEVASAVANTYDFSWCKHVVDVGGGNGTLVTAILQEHSHLEATLFDLEPVIVEARQELNQLGLLMRCKAIGGDFFRSVPEGGDVYILSTVLCNWDEDRAITILKNCRQAMRRDSRLLVVEIVLPTGDEPSPGKLLDLQMMVMTGGRDRTATEYRSLLQAAGFTISKIIPTSSERSIIETVPS
jgi:hypothetical protein